MTRFLDVPAVSSLVNSVGVEAFIAELAMYLRADFQRWEEFTKSPRVANYFPGGVIELMPVSDRTLYSFKYVNGHPGNVAVKLPTVMGFIVLAEAATGLPILISEGTLTTALRTAATSALAASVLARKNSKVMAIVGCGAQSEFQTLAFKKMIGIQEVRYFDLDPVAMKKFASNLSKSGLQLTPADSVAKAVRSADVVTLATADKRHAAVLTPELVRPGLHVNAIGGDCPGKTEVHPEALEHARVFVEFEPQSRHEGDVQQMTPDFSVTELWKVFAGKAQGRTSDQEITVFDSVGFAVEDFSTMRYLYDLSRERNAGAMVDLIATPSDPKDLFGLLL